MDEINLRYPEDITSEEFRYRCFKLLIKEQPDLLSGSNELFNKVKNSVQQGLTNAAEAAKEIGADSIKINQSPDRINKLQNTKTICGIALPMPNELSEAQTHSWSPEKGYIGRAGDVLLENNPIGSQANKILGELASNAGIRKPLIDPGYFADYKGTEPRRFKFSFNFLPRSADEADTIYQIIYKIKKYTLPKTTMSGVSMLSPYIFDVQLSNPRVSGLINMTNLVCTNVTVNYSADGAFQLLPDGTPKLMSVSLDFLERTLVTSDLY